MAIVAYESETYDFSGIELLGLLLLNWRTQTKRAVSISTYETRPRKSPCALYSGAEVPPYEIGVWQWGWDIFAAPQISSPVVGYRNSSKKQCFFLQRPVRIVSPERACWATGEVLVD